MKFKKLIPALCMLLVSATVLGTSTYAWFSMNTTVTATGMEVKAVTDDSLVIKGATNSSDTAFTNVGTNGVSLLTMKPCTSYDGINFAKLGPDVEVRSAHSSNAYWSNNGTFQAGDLVGIDMTDQSTATPYVAFSEYTLKSIANAQEVFVLSITVTTSNANDLNKAIRVSITHGSTMLLFNPCGGSYTDGKSGKYESSAWTLATAPTATTIGSSAATLGTFPGDSEESVMVYIWFEGQDTLCYTDAVDTNSFSIEIEFTTDTSALS